MREATKRPSDGATKGVRFLLAAASSLTLGCASPPAGNAAANPQAISLLGDPLYPMPVSPEVLAAREVNLAAARAAYTADPTDEDRIIWLGRRLAYLGLYDKAIGVFSHGLALHPNSYKLRRHRGHRYITTRRLDDAIADLSAAAKLIEGAPDEVEPDGLPNARNMPTSTSHTNIYYHLGLAHYLKGEFDEALEAYRWCQSFATNDDMRCAASYWFYLTMRRLGRDRDTSVVLDRITADMDIIENFAYHELLLLFKGERWPEQILASESEPGPVGVRIDDATRGYGVGAWYLINGDPQHAHSIFRQVVAGPAWPAFGHIAAEAELARGSP